MSRTTKIPAAAKIAALAGAVGVGALAAVLLRDASLERLPLAVFLAVVAVGLALAQTRISRATTISLCEFPLLTAILTLEPALVIMVGILVGLIPPGRMGWVSRAINVAIFGTSMAVASVFLTWSTGAIGISSPADAPITWLLLGVIAVGLDTALHFLLNGLWSRLAFGYPLGDWYRDVIVPLLKNDPLAGLLVVPLVEMAWLLPGMAKSLPLALSVVGGLGMWLMVQTTRRQVEAREMKDDFFRAIFVSLARLLEMKDPDTAYHSARVALFSRDIARVLGLSEEEQSRIHLAGLLHDVGKVGVPDEILLKPGRLTAEERAIMERHARLSAEAIQGIPGFSDLVRSVYAHHERLDGSGYPEGTVGDDIPMGARILGVADTFEALTSDRPYRPGRSALEALEVFERESHLFDIDVVSALRLLVLSGETADTFDSMADFSHEWSRAARHLEVRLDEEPFILPPERPRHPFAIAPPVEAETANGDATLAWLEPVGDGTEPAPWFVSQ